MTGAKSSSSTEFTAAEGRKFAFPVGLAFLVLAGIAFWRGRETMEYILGGLGGVLLVAGVVIPSRLGPVFRAWMGMAHAISLVTTPIFMGIVYYLVLTPTGLIMRLIGRHPIEHKVDGSGYWRNMEGRPDGDLRRQF